jgi:hypothetical protein
MRQLRRAHHAEEAMAEDPSDREAFRWQVSRLAALEPVVADYLKDAPPSLGAALANSPGPTQRDTLQALADLRAEAATAVLPLLDDPQFAHAELAVELLTWSRDPRVGPWLRCWAALHVPALRRARRRRRASPPLRDLVPAQVPYQAILRALRGHPSRETEAFLLVAARDYDPTYRAAAMSSLGWWEPLHRRQVFATLQEARYDPSREVRLAARGAQARLGERQALHWFRQILTCDNTHRVHEAIQGVAAEGLTLLWPDLDSLADSPDPEIAYHAREALERLSEDLDRPRR